MLNLRPPAESIDDVCQWISPNDPAWDSERTKAEQKVLGDLAVASLVMGPQETDEIKDKYRYDAEITHPLSVWLSGRSKFSHDALLTVPEALRTDEHPAAEVTIGEYLTGTPTIFELRQLGAREYRTVMAMDIEDQEKGWHYALARHGLVRIVGFDAEGSALDAPRGTDGLVEWSWIDWLEKYDRRLIELLSWAVYYICQGSGERGKR